MGHRDEDRRRHRDDRSRSRDGRAPGKSKRPEEGRSSKRTVDDRTASLYETSANSGRATRTSRPKTTDISQQSERPSRKLSPRATGPYYAEMKQQGLDRDEHGNKYVLADIVFENLKTVGGPDTGLGSMAGSQLHEIPEAVDCLAVIPRKRQTKSGRDKGILPSEPVPTTTELVHRPRRDTSQTRAKTGTRETHSSKSSKAHPSVSPESSKRTYKPKEQSSRFSRPDLPDDTRDSRRHHRQPSSRKYHESRSRSRTPSPRRQSSYRSDDRRSSPAREYHGPPLPTTFYPDAPLPTVPSMIGSADPQSARYRAPKDQQSLTPQTYFDYSRSYRGNTQASSGYDPSTYTGTCIHQGVEYYINNGMTTHYRATDNGWYSM